MAHTSRWGILGAAAFAIGVVPALMAQQTTPVVKKEPAPYVTPTNGKQMFNTYCSPCHGVLGKGDGPAAPALNPRPADLTTFAKRHGGKFSRPEFEDKLNGRLMAQGHGSSDMPVWGPIFTQLGQAPLRMSNLANYVESLQAK